MDSSRRILIKRVVVLGSVIVVIIAGLLVWRASTFHVMGTNPDTSAVSEYAPFFKINFSKALANNAVISSEPNIIAAHTIKNKTLALDLWQLETGKDYTITITSISATNGDSLKNLVFRFTAQDIAFDDLPADQQQAILAKQNKKPAAIADPIMKHLPHSTLDYSLSALVVTGDDGLSDLVLQANIFLSSADLSNNKDAAVAQYKQEVLDYIKSIGFNPDKYTIDYQINGS